jgi:ADP-ribose pyrophosphatase
MSHKRFEYDELVFKGRVAEVHRVGVKMPDGRVVQRDYLIYNGAAVILPILDDGSIVLIRNWRFAVEEMLYELPAGMLEPGEDPAVGAARELTEETGYTAGRLEKLGEFFTGPGTCNERMHAYLATGLTPGKQRLESYEQIEVEVVSDAQARAMVADGRIHDGKTIAALGLWWLRKSRPEGAGDAEAAKRS